MKNFNKFGVGVHGKIRVLEGVSRKTKILGGLPKKGEGHLDSLQI